MTLPKPSLTMLWIARLYAMWVLGLGLFHFISYSAEPTRVVINQTMHTTVITHSGPTLSLLLNILLFACLTFGLLMLHRQFCRVIVGVAAIAVLSVTLYNVFHLFYQVAIASSVSTRFLHSVFPLILVGSFWNVVWQFVNIWLSLRPPTTTSKTDNNNFSPFATPQSS